MYAYGMLFLAIICEVIGTTALKYSQGFSRFWPSVVVAVGYAAAFYLMSQSLKALPLNMAYAIWSGVGTAATVVVGMVLWRETLDIARFLGIALIIAGVVVLNTFSQSAAH